MNEIHDILLQNENTITHLTLNYYLRNSKIVTRGKLTLPVK